MFDSPNLLIYHFDPADHGTTEPALNIVVGYAKSSVSFGIAMAMSLQLLFWYYTFCSHDNKKCTCIYHQIRYLDGCHTMKLYGVHRMSLQVIVEGPLCRD